MVDGDYHDLPRQLIAACECGDIETVQQLLDNEESSIEVDCDGGERFTPLQVAAANGHENIVRLLLMRGAGLDTQNSYGWTALMQATYYGHTNIVALLLQNKANPAIKNKMGATALTFAAFKGHSDIVNVFLELSAVDLNDHRVDPYGQSLTPAMAAIVHGHEPILRQFLERGSDQFYSDSGTGWTLLMVAALGGHIGAAQYLIDTGCDPNALNIINSTAFDIAAVCKNKKVKELLERRTTNRPMTNDDSSESKIIEATEQGDIKLVQRILDDDPMQSNRTSVDGATPLMIAAMLGRRDIAEILVQRGSEVNRQDVKSGWTALMQATFHRRKDVVKYLIQAGADLNIQAKDGCKALDLALVIVSDDTDKVGSELTRLLAPITMPTTPNGHPAAQVKGQGQSQMWSTRTNSIDQMEDEETAKRSGLKAWWSRMSNRFRNLKLTRTLRGGLWTTRLTPFEDETSPRPDETLKSMGSSPLISPGEPAHAGVERDGKHQRRKSKDGSRVSFNKSVIQSGLDAVQTLDIESPQSKTSYKLLPVIPPFLPPPNFDLHNADKSRRSHSKAQGMGPGRPSSSSSGNTTTTTTTTSNTSTSNRTHHRPMFTTRRPGSTGISPSNSAHFSSTISPNSSGEASALSRGLGSSRKQSQATSAALISRMLHASSMNKSGDAHGAGSQAEDQGGLVAMRKRFPSASSVPSLAQIPSSPTSRPHNESHTTSSSSHPTRRHSTNPTLVASSSALPPHPKPRSHSGSASTRGSTSSTLTPSPSPTPMGKGRRPSGGGSSHSEGGGGQRDGMRKTSAGSSSISEEDELSNLLRKLSLEKYATIFEEQEVDMEAFLALSDSDLKEMGIRHKEPRNQILTAITQINNGRMGQEGSVENYSPSMARYAFQR